MKLTRRDLPKLWLPLVAALALIGIASLLAWATHLDADKAERERNAATSAKNQIEQRLRQVRTEEQEIKERTQRLQQLQDAGITGEERRLDWMETLRDAHHELAIPGMNYEFGAQTSLDTSDDSMQAWFSSPLRLQLRLLHEEDLLRLLARIQKDAKALVIVRSCKLSPLPRQPDGRDTMAQFGAECEMQWLTVRQSTGKK
jgi:type II secretory pathway pseudopilin PulG